MDSTLKAERRGASTDAGGVRDRRENKQALYTSYLPKRGEMETWFIDPLPRPFLTVQEKCRLLRPNSTENSGLRVLREESYCLISRCTTEIMIVFAFGYFLRGRSRCLEDSERAVAVPGILRQPCVSAGTVASQRDGKWRIISGIAACMSGIAVSGMVAFFLSNTEKATRSKKKKVKRA